MSRVIGGVILGYFLMALVATLALGGAYQLLGSERAFRPGAYEASDTWVAVMAATGLVAALLAGRVCRLVAGSSQAPLILAAVVFLLGVAMAVPELMSGSPPAARPEAVGVAEAMQHARRPPHAALLDPVVGVLGVFLGGRSRASVRAASDDGPPTGGTEP